MTFSIVARCAQTGMFGVAVSSSSPAVAARCAHARAGIGAVASQNITDPALGVRALDLMRLGASASQAIDVLRSSVDFMKYRQLLIVDIRGQSAIHTGSEALGVRAEARNENVACGGNLLADVGVPEAMVTAFLTSEGHLGDRLLIAMRAALQAGGEAGPVRSAGLQIVDKVSWPVADIRVDWTEACPVAELSTIWDIYKPQLDAYVTRALNPTFAPSYGVPGDP
jgi:uncharacterized Ntn-hydrolase superfamily protein